MFFPETDDCGALDVKLSSLCYDVIVIVLGSIFQLVLYSCQRDVVFCRVFCFIVRSILFIIIVIVRIFRNHTILLFISYDLTAQEPSNHSPSIILTICAINIIIFAIIIIAIIIITNNINIYVSTPTLPNKPKTKTKTNVTPPPPPQNTPTNTKTSSLPAPPPPPPSQPASSPPTAPPSPPPRSPSPSPRLFARRTLVLGRNRLREFFFSCCGDRGRELLDMDMELMRCGRFRATIEATVTPRALGEACRQLGGHMGGGRW